MNRITNTLALMATAFILSGALVAWGCSSGSKGAEVENPRGANPCGANPCGANPCGGDAMLDPAEIQQPADWTPNRGGMDEAALLAKAEELWNDPKLGTTNSSCNTCHMTTALYKPSFAKPYPHKVEMAHQRAGLDQVTAAEMVQLCMKIPMGAEPLAWDSVELAALAALVDEKQKEFAASAN
jgi:hypothetical protein